MHCSFERCHKDIIRCIPPFIQYHVGSTYYFFYLSIIETMIYMNAGKRARRLLDFVGWYVAPSSEPYNVVAFDSVYSMQSYFPIRYVDRAAVKRTSICRVKELTDELQRVRL